MCIISLGFVSNISAQIKEVEELWNAQQDSVGNSSQKSKYLSVSKDEMMELFNSMPDFGIYKDNYFITGIPLNEKISNQTADAKYQVSIRQRLFNTIMPYNTQLMLVYTQKSFWNIYGNSSPFKDNNYNPGILLTKPIVNQNKLRGIVAFSAEHESNGRDSLDSRSWNYITLSGTYFVNYNFWIQAKIWHGKFDVDNVNLTDYRGYGFLALNYINNSDRFTASLVINPTKDFRANLQLDLSYQINKRANQSLFLQWYNGYGESLIDYNIHTSMIRLGFCIKSPLKNFY